MVKILDGEFRKNLYKDLVDAGYEKQEAQLIVGKKYYSALVDHVADTLTSLADDVRNERYAENDVLKELFIIIKELPDQFAELSKLNSFLEPYRAKANGSAE